MSVLSGITRLELLARTMAAVGAESDLREALALLAGGVAATLDADLAVIRVADSSGALVARAVAPESSTLAVEVAGSSAAEPAEGAVGDATRVAAERARAATAMAAAAHADGRVVGLVEIVRIVGGPGAEDEAMLELAAAHLALALRGSPSVVGARAPDRAHPLVLAGEALRSTVEPRRVPQQLAALAAASASARGAVVWRVAGSSLELLASAAGPSGEALGASVDIGAGRALAALRANERVAVSGADVALLLGRPATHVLELSFPPERPLEADELAALIGFCSSAARALAAAEHSLELEEELEQTRTLYEVVAEASSRLSLAHTLDTAVERVVDLLRVEHVGVYLVGDDGLRLVAGRELVQGHEQVAIRLLDAVQGPLRARVSLLIHSARAEPELEPVRAALVALGEPAVLGIPLRAREQAIGLLVAYPGARALDESDVTLLSSLASQLAVAVQNARLHEQATGLGAALGNALASERQAARQLRALYEISQSFTQSLSLDTTLDAVTRAVGEVLEVDAAVMRVPDERGDLFVPRAVYVRDSGLSDAVRTILDRPQPRSPHDRRASLLDLDAARRLGGAHALLVPFLEQGSTAALVPLVSGGELLAQLTILSLDPGARIGSETVATARTIAQQAALAIDNARLYQQQKAFAETMQQSLLPRARPRIEGLEVGTVYESAAEVEVGGDVFDFLELPDGRLAVVLGDVTGHGIDATADMAMAKFVFRSLAREHTEPGAFLAHANDVVVGEIAVGKFITMAAIVAAPGGELRCASAGHPQPRLLRADGAVEVLDCGGLALGVDAQQEYEQVRAQLEPGDAVVLYTDGVVEARHGGELYGVERLDELLGEHAGRGAQAIADAVLAACRAFAGGGLGDDCAIVVIRRTPA